MLCSYTIDYVPLPVSILVLLSCITIYGSTHWLFQVNTSTGQKSHHPPANHHAIPSDAQAIIKVLGHQHQWLAGGYDLEIGYFRGG